MKFLKCVVSKAALQVPNVHLSSEFSAARGATVRLPIVYGTFHGNSSTQTGTTPNRNETLQHAPLLSCSFLRFSITPSNPYSILASVRTCTTRLDYSYSADRWYCTKMKRYERSYHHIQPAGDRKDTVLRPCWPAELILRPWPWLVELILRPWSWLVELERPFFHDCGVGGLKTPLSEVAFPGEDR